MVMVYCLARFLETFNGVIFAACPVGWTKLSRQDRGKDPTNVQPAEADLEGAEADLEGGQVDLEEPRPTSMADVVDEAENLVGVLWEQLLQEEPDERCAHWLPEQWWPREELAEAKMAETASVVFLVVGEVIMRHCLRHQFAPYSMCRAKRGDRPENALSDFAGANECCIKQCHALRRYQTCDAVGGTELERVEAGHDAWEKKAQPGTVPQGRATRITTSTILGPTNQPLMPSLRQ